MIEKILGPARDDKFLTLDLANLKQLAISEEGHPPYNSHVSGYYFLPYSTIIHDSAQDGRFQFLPYQNGKISVVRQADVDVLSGPMSGCWLVMFLWQGSYYVAHVVTDFESKSSNFLTKAAWNYWVDTEASVTVIAGFNPYAQWCTSPGFLSVQPSQGNDAFSKVFGLLTPNRELYSIHAYLQMGAENLYRIAGVIKTRNGLERGKYIPV